jgi:hypothetical protein
MNGSTSAKNSKSETELFPNHKNEQEDKDDDIITITETIKLKRREYEVLKIICDTYRLYFRIRTRGSKICLPLGYTLC